MPFRSDRQKHYIHAQAGKGKTWARDFIRHSGHNPPDVRKRAIKRAMRRK